MYHSYYDYDRAFGDIAGAVFAIFTMFFFLFIILAVVSLVFYILRNIGIMTIAQRRKLPAPWLTWIPGVGVYTLGAIADDINGYRGKSTVFRYLLLGAVVAQYIPSILSAILTPLLYSLPEAAASMFSVLIMLAIIGCSLMAFVVQIMATYQIFACYSPQNAVLFTVLAFFPLTSIAGPFFFFSIRNNPGDPALCADGGYAAPPVSPTQPYLTGAQQQPYGAPYQPSAPPSYSYTPPQNNMYTPPQAPESPVYNAPPAYNPSPVDPFPQFVEQPTAPSPDDPFSQFVEQPAAPSPPPYSSVQPPDAAPPIDPWDLPPSQTNGDVDPWDLPEKDNESNR